MKKALLTLLLLATASAAQEPALEDRVERAMESLRGRTVLVPLVPRELAAAPRRALDALAPYHGDASPLVRQYANAVAAGLARELDDPALRRGVVDGLAAALRDPEALVRQSAGRELLQFEAGDFGPAARAVLGELLQLPAPPSAVIRAAGVAEMRDATERLRALAAAERTAWPAQLALARLGDPEALAACLEREAAEPSLVLRATRLWPDLAFTRQPAAYGPLAEALAGDGRLPSVSPGRPGTPAAQYAADALAGSLRESPVPKRILGTYTDEDRARLRTWIEESSR